ncbi:MAG TPA: hypothetical protein VHY30_09875, partial [Verrucomicrobiae bacterium]|nr:hypothetical protein [Verrucomicrobiae bacterium]
MNAQLVKIDVAADLMNLPVPEIMLRVDGGTLDFSNSKLRAQIIRLSWVFNFARDPNSRDRELRLWRPELCAQASKDVSVHRKYNFYELDWVINKILPEKKRTIHAGELDQLFQLRPRTRIDLHDEICGTMMSGRNSYSRDIIAAFLKRRWLASLREAGQCGSHLSPDKAKTLHPIPAQAEEATVNRPGRSRIAALTPA